MPRKAEMPHAEQPLALNKVDRQVLNVQTPLQTSAIRLNAHQGPIDFPRLDLVVQFSQGEIGEKSITTKPTGMVVSGLNIVTILETNVESYRRRSAQAMATPVRKVNPSK